MNTTFNTEVVSTVSFNTDIVTLLPPSKETIELQIWSPNLDTVCTWLGFRDRRSNEIIITWKTKDKNSFYLRMLGSCIKIKTL